MLYYVKDLPDGRFELWLQRPIPDSPGVHCGPCKVVEIDVPGTCCPPTEPVTQEEWDRFVKGLPAGAKVTMETV